jgi:MHS family citrate/tricarballylate:H+ symporter-like MFS transporter
VLIGRLLQGFPPAPSWAGFGLSGRDRHPGPQRLLHQLAVGQQQVAIMVAAAMGFALNAVLEQSAISDWGWRIPFLSAA